MRARLAILLAFVGFVTASPLPLIDVAHARDGVVLAQEGDPTGEDNEAEGQEEQGGEGEGQGGAEAETGAGGQTEGGESTEVGPPWTYQMARISVVLLVGLALGIGLIYHRLVMRRQRGQV
ncbi:hypothetical protein BH24ACT26_BH24ACT26_20390 [soil metagenome]